MASALLPRISTALRDTEYCSVSSSSYSSSLELLGGSSGVSEKRSLFKFDSRRALVAGSSLGNGTGGGVMDRPTIERTTPGRESEFDLRKSRKTSPPYKVLLHNDNFNKREYVVQVLMKVIPGMTVDTAVNIMQEAHYNGMAVVIVCGQPDAEEHCMQLRGNGLLSSIEPASGGC